MGINAMSAPGPKVSQRNPLGVLYILGDETTDGGVRIILGGDDLWKVEFRKEGIWDRADPIGFHRMLVNNVGEILSDNNGNVIYGAGT